MPRWVTGITLKRYFGFTENQMRKLRKEVGVQQPTRQESHTEGIILTLRREFEKTIKQGKKRRLTTKEDCKTCKRYNDSPEICFDYPELDIIKARENCSIHNKEACHGL